jgi:folate-binding protein YgfZ
MDEDLLERLSEGTAVVDLSTWRTVAVDGPEALHWLNDLVSADLSDLAPTRAKRSLLLSPTGRVRAQFMVTVAGGSVLLIQDPAQPRSILTLLSPYTLSHEVELDDRTDALALFAFPGRTEAPEVAGAIPSAPSCVGPGADLIVPAGVHDRVLATLSTSFAVAGRDDLESWRVKTGVPRLGVDVLEEDLPEEGGLADAVAFDKGCYLGQEAVARVRNLGHPRRLVVHLQTEDGAPVSVGDAVHADGREVGTVTSAARDRARWVVLARVRWDAARGPLETSLGATLRPMSTVPG